LLRRTIELRNPACPSLCFGSRSAPSASARSCS
jgi:hypothetical protein